MVITGALLQMCLPPHHEWPPRLLPFLPFCRLGNLEVSVGELHVQYARHATACVGLPNSCSEACDCE